MDKAFLQHLKNYEWRGNIRELKNMIERAIILCETETLTADLLPSEIMSSDLCLSDTSLESLEKIHIHKILQQCKGNKTKAAELLGIGLTTLYRKMDEYHIEK